MLHRVALVAGSRSQAAYRQIGVLVFGSGLSATIAPSSSPAALCEEKKGILDTVLSKDKNGSIDFGKSLNRFVEPNFWDELAGAIGQNVSTSCCRYPRQRRRVLTIMRGSIVFIRRPAHDTFLF